MSDEEFFTCLFTGFAEIPEHIAALKARGYIGDVRRTNNMITYIVQKPFRMCDWNAPVDLERRIMTVL